MRKLWVMLTLCLCTHLGAITIDWTKADWSQAQNIVPGEWITLPTGENAAWAIRMAIPSRGREADVVGSLRHRNTEGQEAERGIVTINRGHTVQKIEITTRTSSSGTERRQTLDLTYGLQWFEWRVSADYAQLFAVNQNGGGAMLCDWKVASLGFPPTQVSLFVSNPDGLELPAYYLSLSGDGNAPEPSAVLLLATLSTFAFLHRPRRVKKG